MNILAITAHASLVERLRTAFEGAGHLVQVSPDPLRALAEEAWNSAHLILVDAQGDPMDGYHFCGLLRGESRALFRSLPIFLVLDHAPEEEDLDRLRQVEGDGFLDAADSVGQLLQRLAPALEGAPDARARLAVLAAGLRQSTRARVQGILGHYGYDVHACGRQRLQECLASLRPPLLLLGVEGGCDKVQADLELVASERGRCYPILLGRVPGEAEERRLWLAGAMDWVPAPFSAPRLLHACHRGTEWLRVKRVQRAFQAHIQELRERRILVEMEAASLRDQVLTDPLTGLLNRRAFDQHLEHAMNQWERHHRPFVLILGDLDFFKLINDRFGHLVGDKVLQGVAQRLRSSLRKADLAFRTGGEEFAVLLLETRFQAGVEVADKIRRRIEEEPLALDTGQRVYPTMSLGVGGPKGHDVVSLYAATDHALYVAKRKGRNRVERMPGQEGD